MSGRMAGRVAVVTGASRGIGRSIAEAFAAEDAAVVVAARTLGRGDDDLPGSLEETVEAITARGGRAVAAVCDVTVDEDLVQLVEVATSEFGPIDTLVNNAAATVPGRPGRRPRASARGSSSAIPTVLDLPLRSVRTQFEVNLFAPWRLMQLVVPPMADAGRGWIVNIGSEAARMPADTGAYGTSKLALEHLTAAVAAAVGARGIAVNALLPSLPIPTPGLQWVGGRAAREQSPEDFAEAAVRVALADPTRANGEVLHSDDVLRPELGRRGWQGR
jgi:7-alpha-hydroxysteroid dehydrogenase